MESRGTYETAGSLRSRLEQMYAQTALDTVVWLVDASIEAVLVVWIFE